MSKILNSSGIFNFIAGSIISMATTILFEIAQDFQLNALVTMILMFASGILFIVLSERIAKIKYKYDELCNRDEIESPLQMAFETISREELRADISDDIVVKKAKEKKNMLIILLVISCLLFLISIVTLFCGGTTTI